ncbi:hypothetical protein R1T16_04560 [Flavobacterium sp. DG1-102-2]|uniref:hypothetical protein n=1 Tax=Flavobacterium sp. DG1-102-2 TaxID=3081663 RepID=UPI00294A5771|nr:hypothetical protein [Flavobacterium sp. DG1-102-2]MDV6167684.1 hypothetical protein [Flavobacterium sp. DG1-102-2]
MKYRILGTQNSDLKENENLIGRLFDLKLQIARIVTVKSFKPGQILNVPENLLDKIQWKYLNPNIDSLDGVKSYKICRNISLADALTDLRLVIDQFGRCYFIEDNSCLVGFIYINNFQVFTEGIKNLPRLHMSINCRAIEEQVLFGILVNDTDEYKLTFTNSLINDVIDRHSGKLLKNQDLEICKYCKGNLPDDDIIIELYKTNEILTFNFEAN